MSTNATHRSSLLLDGVLVAVIAVWTAMWGYLQWHPSAISWHFFTLGANALFGTSGLHVYAQHPDLQIGPLSFVVAAFVGGLPSATARTVIQVVMLAAGPLLVWWLAPLVVKDRRVIRITIAALLVVPPWSVLAVRWAHLDDVMAMIFAVAAVRAVAGGRAVLAGLAVAAAIASKPWAVGFIPVLLVIERKRVLAFVAAALGVVAAWAPFLIADVNTLRAFRPNVPVSSDSGLWFWHYRGTHVPSWGRTSQLVAAPLFAFLAVLRQRWPALFIVAFCARLALDPQDLPYYMGGAAIAAVIFDLLATRWIIPWVTVTVIVMLWQPFVADFTSALVTTHGLTFWWFAHPAIVGASHVLWCAIVIVFTLMIPQRWLGLENPALPKWTWRRATEPSADAPAIETGSL